MTVDLRLVADAGGVQTPLQLDGGGALVASDATAQARLADILAAVVGTVAVSAAGLPLPAGAATETTLADVLARLLATLDVAGSVAVSNLPATQPVSASALPLPAGAATETTLQQVRRAQSDQRTRLDYDVRTDANPVYVAKAVQGTPTSSGVWVVQRLSYDGDARATDVQTLVGAWDDRAALPWD